MRPENRLVLVAWLFILGGVLAVAVALQRRSIAISTGLLEVPIGLGLLHRSSLWHRVALVVLLVGLVVTPAVLLLNMQSLRFGVDAFYLHYASRSPSAVLAAVAVAYAVVIWQLWVLTRHDVRQLFDPNEPDRDAS